MRAFVPFRASSRGRKKKAVRPPASKNMKKLIHKWRPHRPVHVKSHHVTFETTRLYATHCVRVTREGNETGQNMSGSEIGSNSAHDQLGRFTAGNSEYRAKRVRIAALVEQLAADYAATSGTAKALLRVAAEHIDAASRARNNVLRSRATRMAAKTLALLRPAPEPPLPTLDEMLAADEAADG